MIDKVEQLDEQHGRKVSLVGWSLGGIYARQLAKMLPDEVRQVITLGSPFAGDPRATNAWRLYEFTSGHKVDDRERHMGGSDLRPAAGADDGDLQPHRRHLPLAQLPRKGGPQAENIEVEGSHCGLGHHPAAVYAIADRLAQPEGKWKQFDRGGLKALFFPDPKR